MAAPTQTRRITISVDTNGAAGLKDIADKLGGINKNTKDLAKGFNLLGAATSAFLGLFSVRELAAFSDEIQVLNNRLVAVTGSQEQATQTLSQLQLVARETNSSLESTAQTYLTIAQSTKAANLSTSTLLDLTKTLTNTFRLSGASAEEAATATKTLALGFQLGGIQGRELRTIMRQNTVLAGLLRKEFGSALKSDAQLGFLTVGKLMEILHKNMDGINSSAQVLTSTFGQTLTKAFDALKVKVFDLSTALDLPGTLAVGMQFLINNMDAIITLGAILTTLTIPGLVSGFTKLAASLLTLSPLTVGLVVGLTAVVALFGNSFKIPELITQLEVGFARFQAGIDDLIGKFYDLNVAAQKFTGGTGDGFVKLAAAAHQAAADHRVHAQALQIESDNLKILSQAQADGSVKAANWGKDIQSAYKKLPPDLNAKDLLAQLNREFEKGTITLSQYNEEVLKLDLKKANRDFHDGTIDVGKYHDELRKVREFDINRDFKDGRLSINEWNAAIKGVQLDKLNEDLEAGRISLADYNAKIAAVSANFNTGGAFRTGLQDYLNAIGTTTQQVANAITNAFKGLEDVFLSFIKTGTANFAQFTQAILDDLTRIIIRATIIQPLATGILGAITPAAGATAHVPQGGPGNYAVPNALGNIYNRGLVPFATGGIVTRPTTFAFGNGGAGLMGEKGAEAILPLQRGSGGKLGVAASVNPVTINITNNTPAEVQQTTKTGPSGEKTIEILIVNKVREGIAGGSFDKSFQSSFGLNRKGQ